MPPSEPDSSTKVSCIHFFAQPYVLPGQRLEISNYDWDNDDVFNVFVCKGVHLQLQLLLHKATYTFHHSFSCDFSPPSCEQAPTMG